MVKVTMNVQSVLMPEHATKTVLKCNLYINKYTLLFKNGVGQKKTSAVRFVATTTGTSRDM